MEVNSSPGLEGIEAASGVDIATLIIEFIENNAAPGKTANTGVRLEKVVIPSAAITRSFAYVSDGIPRYARNDTSHDSPVFQAVRKVTKLMDQPFEIAGQGIAPGESRIVHIPVANLYTNTPVTLPVRVVRGKKPGPVMFVQCGFAW